MYICQGSFTFTVLNTWWLLAFAMSVWKLSKIPQHLPTSQSQPTSWIGTKSVQSLMTLTWFFLSCHTMRFEVIILNNYWMKTIKCAANIHVLLRMNCKNFGDLTTFHSAPSMQALLLMLTMVDVCRITRRWSHQDGIVSSEIVLIYCCGRGSKNIF